MHVYPRYERHAELIGVGERGQEKLFSSKVFIIGAGGLGCPALLYLAAAGIGHITIADHDSVSLSNLQRQILYGNKSVDRLKVEGAKEAIHVINPEITINPVATRMTPENISSFVKDHDIVLDCSDNFDTRYLINDTVLGHEKTLVSGSVIYYEGQVYVFKLGAPCYRCLYPVKPQSHEAPTCAESAVLGPVPGVIGTLMAVETIKELLGIGDSLSGSFLSYSALSSTFSKIKISNNSECWHCKIA